MALNRPAWGQERFLRLINLFPENIPLLHSSSEIHQLGVLNFAAPNQKKLIVTVAFPEKAKMKREFRTPAAMKEP